MLQVNLEVDSYVLRNKFNIISHVEVICNSVEEAILAVLSIDSDASIIMPQHMIPIELSENSTTLYDIKPSGRAKYGWVLHPDHPSGISMLILETDLEKLSANNEVDPQIMDDIAIYLD